VTAGRRRTRRPAATTALAAACLLALSACGSGDDDGSGSSSGSGSGSGSGSAGGSDREASRPELTVRDAYVPEPIDAGMAGGFLTVRNSGATADKLTSVESDDFDDAQLHKTVNRRMQHVKSLPVPANGELRLSRGGNHIMFLKAERKPVEGEKVPVTLHFEKSDPVKVSMPVEATNHVPEK
jgi:periplasmic copper chaperone A